MAYRFKLSEPIKAGVRRIGVEEIDRAITELTSTAAAPTAVHEARKSLKRVRALLRLVRPAIGEAAFARENGFFRETGALLSHVRDREILLDTVVKLEARAAEPSPPASGDTRGGAGDALARLRMSLSGEAAGKTGRDDDKARARAEAAARLRKARARFLRLELEPDGFEALSAGLAQSFRRAARMFERAYDAPSDETMHDWRKGCQQHWRHMLLLRRAWPEMADTRMHAARRLSQMLGDDHDLAILRHHLATANPARLNTRDLRAVARLAAQRQDELRSLAQPLGAKLFADKPRALGRQFALYWTAAQALRGLRAGGDGRDDA